MQQPKLSCSRKKIQTNHTITKVQYLQVLLVRVFFGLEEVRTGILHRTVAHTLSEVVDVVLVDALAISTHIKWTMPEASQNTSMHNMPSR